MIQLDSKSDNLFSPVSQDEVTLSDVEAMPESPVPPPNPETQAPVECTDVLLAVVREQQLGCIVLNIGGTVFEPSIPTVRNNASSILALVCSNKFAYPVLEEGSAVRSYFFDREPTHFRYVLNYLQSKGMCSRSLFPTSDTARRELLEVKFYRLNGFIQKLETVLQEEEE
ncbi:BTB/POZ domain-containing protein KCTD7-like [Liolophura sinensis]|uniref:BTB/POZ domain-containing protein KCTD7-like n=1 Tax=Liolophura sinensis TaxID=3198878 RepID=UPI00315949F4